MEPEGSLSHSQVPATCPYPEPARSSPHPHIPLLKIHLNIIPPSNRNIYNIYYMEVMSVPRAHVLGPKLLNGIRLVEFISKFTGIKYKLTLIRLKLIYIIRKVTQYLTENAVCFRLKWHIFNNIQGNSRSLWENYKKKTSTHSADKNEILYLSQ